MSNPGHAAKLGTELRNTQTPQSYPSLYSWDRTNSALVSIILSQRIIPQYHPLNTVDLNLEFETESAN